MDDKQCLVAYLIATRNIKAGEELTQNYPEFESKKDLRRRGINVTNHSN